MDTVRLGRTDLQVSRICHGTWQFGGDWGAIDEPAAIAAIRHAREHGVTFFDTAQGYGFGTAERLLGHALDGDLRGVVIATKGGLRMDGDDLVRDSSPAWLRQGVESSLRALGTDHIDLYQVHWPDPRTPLAVTAQALQDLVAEGLIRHVGVSNFDTDQLRAFPGVETIQPPYHLFRRDVEADVLPYAADRDLGVLIYGPLAHGLLGGALDEHTTFPGDDWRSHSPDFAGPAYHRNLEAVAELRRYAGCLGITIGQLAVAWVLSHPSVHVAIVGARDPLHLEESLEAAELTLGPDDLAEIDRIMTGTTPLTGPCPEGM
ncbi:aldo/keto reductase [Nonomuraea maritima]|uniref:aldo/keto reductase n=1 Tax=Nonomuraea maritima TaxID=683260 RepID=UPI00371F9227